MFLSVNSIITELTHSVTICHIVKVVTNITNCAASQIKKETFLCMCMCMCY